MPLLPHPGETFATLETYWRSPAISEASLDEREQRLVAALHAQYRSEGGAALLAALGETGQRMVVCVDVDPWLGMQAAGGISSGQNKFGKALMALRDEAAAA